MKIIKEFIRKLLIGFQPPVIEEDKPLPRESIFSTDLSFRSLSLEEIEQYVQEKVFQKPQPVVSQSNMAMDGISGIPGSLNPGTVVPDALMMWYASQSFIGYQLCAIFAQQWLIAKCCLMPAKDAVRNGYEITINDGTDVDPDILGKIREADSEFGINRQMIEMVQMGRIFGIRIVIFNVESDDPDFYQKPFNIDGVTEGSYKGITQIDPYWCTPQLDNQAAGNPAAPDFYEPTWWRVNGKLYHRSHLIVFRTEEVADIIKPSYIYGGISIPQKIYERVYAAERTANEAPQLALTKRTDVVTTDTAQALAQQGKFQKRALLWANLRDNYGIKFINNDEKMERFDTTLADLDAVIMTQYQLVAAAANIPAVKLLGTQPKGFNSTGEYEEASYHEELESLQEYHLTPFLNRHHELLIKSKIAPNNPFNVSIAWNPLDAMTNQEKAELNKLKAEAGQTLIASGAIDGMDERKRVIADPDSGYNGLLDVEVEPSDLEENIYNNPEGDVPSENNIPGVSTSREIQNEIESDR